MEKQFLQPQALSLIQPDQVSPMLYQKYLKLIEIIQDLKEVKIAYSGGIDSAFLLKISYHVLGDRCIAITAISESYAPWEREEAQKLALEIGVKQIEIYTNELQNPQYRANVGDRCYHCKTALFDTAVLTAQSLSGVLCYGAITDDLQDDRPGMKAAQERGVKAPLIEAQLYKNEIRTLAKLMHLRVWDKPASACLSSRFPYGTEIDAQKLSQISQCEGELRKLGFRQFRARYHESILRIELSPEDLRFALNQAELREKMVQIGKAQGFKFVTLDLEGYRSAGSTEQALIQIR
jgi:uncharacterized protein